MKVLFCIVLISFASALEEDLVKELKCNQIPAPKIDLDLNWFGSINQFYLPIWNQLYATRTAADLFGRHSRYISWNDVQPSSCLIFRKDNTVAAFGQKILYNITGSATDIKFKAPWAGSKLGHFNFHMTDNKSFVLGITCWDDNEATWAVISSEPYLETSTRRQILDYVTRIGFDERKAIDENYGLCGHQSTPIRPQAYSRPRQPFYIPYGRY